jgi:hypothetical protein
MLKILKKYNVGSFLKQKSVFFSAVGTENTSQFYWWMKLEHPESIKKFITWISMQYTKQRFL